MTLDEWLSQRPRLRFSFEADTGTMEPQQPDPSLMGALGRLVDLASVGLYAVANVADAMLKGDYNVAAAAWRGLTLQERKTFVDVLKAHGVAGAPLIGFVLDMGLDPMTFLGSKVIRLLTPAAKALAGKEWVRAATEALKEFSIVDTLGRAFSSAWKKPEGYVELRATIRRQFTDAQRESWERALQLTRELSDAERQIMAEVRYKPWRLTELSERAQQRYHEIASKLEEYAWRGVKEGLWTEETALRWLEEYVPIRYTERLRPLAIRVGGRPGVPTFTKPRTFKNIDEAAEWANDIASLARARSTDEALQLAKALDEKWKGTFFTENVTARSNSLNDLRSWAEHEARLFTPQRDIARIMLVYETEWHQYHAQKTFISEVLKRWGKPVTEGVTPGPKEDIFPVPEFMRRAFPADRWILPKEVARDLNDMTVFFEGGKDAARLLRWLDRLTGNWKALATVWRLPYHIRNAYGNYFMMWLAGTPVEDMPRLTLEAARILAADNDELIRVLGRKADDIVPGLNRTYREALRDFRRLGIVQTGFLSSELGSIRDMYAFIRGEMGRWQLPDIVRQALDVPARVGRAVESSARVALMLDGLVNKGLGELDAARRVFKYLFDYEELTPFEREWARRIVPFYTYVRKNIPVQIEAFLRDPSRYMRPYRAIHALNSAAGLSQDEWETLPSWMRDILWVKLPFKTSSGKPLYAYIDLPSQDLSMLASMEMDDLFIRFHPIVDMLLAAANIDPQRFGRLGGAQMERFPGEMEPAPAWVALMPEAVQRALSVAPMLERHHHTWVLGWPKKVRNAVETLFPALNQLRAWDALFARLSQAPAYVEPEDAPWRLVSWASGIRFRPVDLAEERRWRILERRQRLGWAAALVRQRGRALTPEELDALLE